MNTDDLKNNLSEEEYKITQEGGTEAPFSGKYWDNHEEGMYFCTVCDKPLFSSTTKFDSGSGWPSFDAPEHEDAVEERSDNAHGMVRTEVVCQHCGAHLGHLFDDGPTDTTGMRYCVNSASLQFKQK